MNVSLVLVHSDGSSKEVPVDHLPLVIGRDEAAKLRIPKANVSRRHCELAENEDDELVVRDLSSSNGTYVNGERVRERELVPGDLLTIGDMVFVVRIDGHPREIDAADCYAAGTVMLGGTPVTPMGGSRGGSGSGAGASGGSGPKTELIEGVPTWGSGGGGGGSKPAAAKPAAPRKADAEPDDFSDLLAGIELDEDEEDFPRKKSD